jgi:hypothetical protein
MNDRKDKKIVVVTGDVTIDWNIARVRRSMGIGQVWNADDLTSACYQRGGAAMLAHLIKAVAKNLQQSKQGGIDVRQNGVPRGRICPDDRQFHHSYAIWEPFEIGDLKSNQKGKVWRVQEFLGLYQEHTGTALHDDWKKIVKDPTEPDLIVLDDAALGFRDNPVYWPKALSSNVAKPWIIQKMARPVAQGRLWEHLQKDHAERLVVIMTANDLRRSQVHISRQLSWERTAQDLVWELIYNPHVNRLTRCAHVIISFGPEGALLLSQKSSSAPEAVLFFDPKAMEAEWVRQYKGHMIGYTTCLTASIARELILNGSQPNIACGIQSGIRAMRFLHVEGYGYLNNDMNQMNLAFPTSGIATKLTEEGDVLAVAAVRNPAPVVSAKASMTVPKETAHFWTILEDRHPHSLDAAAKRIVLEGLERALEQVPISRFGKLVTVDRKEIEGLRSISSLIREYCQQPQNKPLSIAVFGPPGSGKSFAVKQVADSVLPGEIEALNFNLSQFGGPDNLLDAFHQVRDRALYGKIPLVFWDEFDAALQGRQLGWLSYFIAPMQDGEFQEGQITHPIGRSIFVFAGGTCRSMEEFASNCDSENARSAKLPDFISRLKGFLNILGPNQIEIQDAHGKTKDPYYIIRRAIILRSIFERNAPQLQHNEDGKKILNIDQGVLRAFLLTKEYKHGARSMEAIVAMSQLAGKTSFERSSLPSETQLNLHVDGRDFVALLHRIELNQDLLERLAEAAHEVFCDDLRSRGYKYGRVTSDKQKKHSSLKPYDELPEEEKEQNRSNARDIENKLASIGYAIIPARSDESPSELSNDEVEKLAEMEHERWMNQKIATGWKWASTTDKSMKLHRDLVPWNQLTHEEQEKDRILVKGISRIIAEAGYTMVKLSQ